MGVVRACRAIASNRSSFATAASSCSHAPQPPTESASTSVTETVNGSHDFKITGYSLSKGLGIGRYIASDTFTVGGYEWAIYFYPDGKSVEDNATYVSLFIALASEGTDVRALFELSLRDQSGKEQHKVHSHFGRNLEGGPYTLKYRGSMWGYKRFFKRNALEASDYLKDDCLSVNCTVGVVRSLTEGPKIYTIPVPPSNIAQHFGQLLKNEKETDVSFDVKGEIFSAHKLVLAARSPVFRAQLFGPVKDKNMNCIKVGDVEPPVFKAGDYAHRRYKIVLRSTMGPIDVYLVSQFEEKFDELSGVETPPRFRTSYSGLVDKSAVTMVTEDYRGKGLEHEVQDTQMVCSNSNVLQDVGMMKIVPSDIDVDADYWLMCENKVSITDMWTKPPDVQWDNQFVAGTPLPHTPSCGVNEVPSSRC